MNLKKNAGLTLTEVLITTSLLAILLGLGTVVFSSFARQDQVRETSKKIVSVLSEAQAKTRAGYSYGGGASLNFGVHFESDFYTLFSGTSFDPNDPNNQEFNFSSRLEISQISLPSGNVIFEKITGQVYNFDLGQNYLVLSDQRAGQEKRININKLGVATIE